MDQVYSELTKAVRACTAFRQRAAAGIDRSLVGVPGSWFVTPLDGRVLGIEMHLLASLSLLLSVVFWTHRGDTGPDNDATQQDWIEWMAATFRAEVCQNFVLLPVYRADGR
jgi:hypothetical protein